MQLSPHFEQHEFEKDGAIPDACLPVLTDLAKMVLEPIRAHVGGGMVITSGYRTPEANAEAHGQPNSEHIYTPAWCACDFYVPGQDSRPVFDWARNNPVLPFHQLILEHSATGMSVIHVSLNRRMPGMRSVLEGATHNAEPYTKVDYVAFAPQEVHLDEA